MKIHKGLVDALLDYYTICPCCLPGISSPPKPGSTVKLLDGYLHLGEPVFTVEAVEGSKASLGGIDKTVNVEKVVLAADSGM